MNYQRRNCGKSFPSRNRSKGWKVNYRNSTARWQRRANREAGGCRRRLDEEFPSRKKHVGQKEKEAALRQRQENGDESARRVECAWRLPRKPDGRESKQGRNGLVAFVRERIDALIFLLLRPGKIGGIDCCALLVIRIDFPIERLFPECRLKLRCRVGSGPDLW